MHDVPQGEQSDTSGDWRSRVQPILFGTTTGPEADIESKDLSACVLKALDSALVDEGGLSQCPFQAAASRKSPGKTLPCQRMMMTPVSAGVFAAAPTLSSPLSLPSFLVDGREIGAFSDAFLSPLNHQELSETRYIKHGVWGSGRL